MSQMMQFISVPVGKYTRQALVNLGILDKVDDVSTIPTETISEKLGGVVRLPLIEKVTLPRSR